MDPVDPMHPMDLGAELAALGDRVGPPGVEARSAVQARLAASTSHHPGGPSDLGDLSGLAAHLSSWHPDGQPAEPRRPRLVVLAADHGIGAVVAAGEPPTVDRVAAALPGGALAGLAASAGVGVRVVDLGIREVSGRIDVEDAMTAQEAWAALQAGIRLADEEVDAGADLLLLAAPGEGGSVVAAAIVATCLHVAPVDVAGSSAAIGDSAWMYRTAAIRDAVRRARRVQHDAGDLLLAVGGVDVAAAVGLLLQAAVRRTPVLLDGGPPLAAAVLAAQLSALAKGWWLAAHATDAADERAISWLGLRPAVQLGLHRADGTGPLLAVPILRAAAALARSALGPPATPSSAPGRTEA